VGGLRHIAGHDAVIGNHGDHVAGGTVDGQVDLRYQAAERERARDQLAVDGAVVRLVRVAADHHVDFIQALDDVDDRAGDAHAIVDR
jgi:muconolactone delta-isomerase